jgi:uncharacterized protein (DUF3084 family)
MSDVVGTSIGDYRLEALLGAGRSGQVYRAAHVRFDAVRVALRVFAAEVAASGPDSSSSRRPLERSCTRIWSACANRARTIAAGSWPWT